MQQSLVLLEASGSALTEASQLPPAAQRAEQELFVLDFSVAPSVQPGPCQRPCHICLGPVPTASPHSRVTKAGSS